MKWKRQDIEQLKVIHFKETGERLSDQEAIEMSNRIISLLRIIAKPIPENNQESDE